MTPENEEPKRKEKEEKEEDERVLMCPEEWTDPECRKVLGEYHKGVPLESDHLDQDMKAFENVWTDRGRRKVAGEYHKEGAPFLGWTEEGTVALPPEATTPKEYLEKLREEGVPERPPGEGPKKIDLQRTIDLGTFEIITYALFRAVFGKGIKIPIKREGMVDMDVVVRGKDIIVNTNQFFFVVPDLAVWRVMYSHKGQTIMEFGRGVDKGLKIHRLQAIRLLFCLWKESRKNQKAKERLRAAQLAEAEVEG